MRLFTAILVGGFSMLSFAVAGPAATKPDSPPAAASAKGGLTLLGTFAKWKYPGSTLRGNSTMSDGGNPLIQDVTLQVIVTTPDSVEKVVAYYSKELGVPPMTGSQNASVKATDATRKDAEAEMKGADAASVSIQDDSQGRPVALRVILVNQAERSTTLVISRADGEKETHIAWSQYVRLGGKR